MILKVYTVYDAGVGAFKPPFFVRGKGEAIRSWRKLVNEDGNAYNSHPEDFTLFELGEFDDQTGKVTNLDTPHSLGLALEFLERDAIQKVGSKHFGIPEKEMRE